MRLILKIATSLVALIQAKELNVGIFADVHLNLKYNPKVAEDSCGAINPYKTMPDFFQIDGQTPIALLGRLGCDPPLLTLEYLLQNFVKQHKNVNFLTLNGDLIVHGLAQDATSYNNQDNDKYTRLMNTHKVVQQTFTKYLPNTPIFLSFGNNDAKFHDNAPHFNEKSEYYTELYNMWFVNHPGNKKWNTPEVK